MWDERTDVSGTEFDYPPNDSDRTWHMHDDDTWGWGISCSVCLPEPRHGTARWPKGASEVPQLAIRHLRSQNATAMTTRELEREALGDRWDDPKVQRVT